jgi:hypothetical protein
LAPSTHKTKVSTVFEFLSFVRDFPCLAFAARQERQAFHVAFAQETGRRARDVGDARRRVVAALADADQKQHRRFDLAFARKSHQRRLVDLAFEFFVLDHRRNDSAG